MKKISVCKFLCDYFLFSVICCQNQNIGRDVNVLHKNQGRNFSVIVLHITSAYVPRGLSVLNLILFPKNGKIFFKTSFIFLYDPK